MVDGRRSRDQNTTAGLDFTSSAYKPLSDALYRPSHADLE